MGLQRHIKVLGIFARLWHRDGKPGYLGDLPRVLDYTLAVTRRTAGTRGVRRLPAARGRARIRRRLRRTGACALKAMILAAGRGERMRPLTANAAEAAARGGRPSADRVSPRLARLELGVREVVINLSWHGERIREALGDGAGHGLSIQYSEEGPEPLGTGGGSSRRCRCSALRRSCVVNGDVWSDFAMQALRPPPGSLAHLVLVDNPAHHPEGDYGLEPGGLARRRPGTPDVFRDLGARSRAVRGLRPGILPLKPLLDAALAQGRLTGQRHAGGWRDVGTPARLAALDAELRLGRARHPVLSSPVG